MQARVHVIAGPIKGANFILKEGENSLGRATSCDIVLQSSQVSKRHAILSLTDKKLELVDAGSANGSFVNGVLSKKKILKRGDKISIGPFVLEVLVSGTVERALAPQGNTSLAALGGQPSLGQSEFSHSSLDASPDLNINLAPEPKSLVAKLLRRFDEVVLPVIYEFNKSYDWLTVVVGIFAGFLVINIGMTVYPLMDAAKESVLKETESKAVYIAKQMTHLNATALAEKSESKLDVSFTEIDINVQEAVIVNIEGRILAPGSRLNELYNEPLFLKYRDRLRGGDQKNWQTKIGHLPDGTLVVADPIMVISKSKGMNVPGAISVVKYSTGGSALDSGTVGVVYFEALVMSGLIGVVFIYLLYQFSMNPLRVLNDDMDAVLKGNLDTIAKRFKFDILNQLIDTINATLSRIPKNDGEGNSVSAVTDDGAAAFETIQSSVLSFSKRLNCGLILLDAERRVRHINGSFEETSGIHSANAMGDVIDNVCRDEALASLMRDLLDRSVSAGTEGIAETFEFGSGTHAVSCQALTGALNRVDAYLIFAEKAES